MKRAREVTGRFIEQGSVGFVGRRKWGMIRGCSRQMTAELWREDTEGNLKLRVHKECVEHHPGNSGHCVSLLCLPHPSLLAFYSLNDCLK